MKIQPIIDLQQSKVNNQPSFGIKCHKIKPNEEVIANLQKVVDAYISKIPSSKASFPERVKALNKFAKEVDKIKNLIDKRISRENKLKRKYTIGEQK